MIRRDLVLAIIYIVAGIGMFIVSQAADLGDSLFVKVAPGMGGALIAIGIIRLYRGIRLEKDPEYRENFEVETHDERNRFLRATAWAWAGYLFILGGGIGTIVFMVLNNDVLMKACSFSVCIMLVLYWVSYLIVRRKY